MGVEISVRVWASPSGQTRTRAEQMTEEMQRKHIPWGDPHPAGKVCHHASSSESWQVGVAWITSLVPA